MFRTSDIVLAATLKVHNFNIIDIEIDGPRGIFIFSSIDEEFLDKFDMGQLQVEPNGFHQAIKQLTTAVRRKLR